MSEIEAPKRPRFLTVEQVAEELSAGVPLVRSLLKSGELRGIQIGAKRLWRISSADLEDYIVAAYAKVAAGHHEAGQSGSKPQ